MPVQKERKIYRRFLLSSSIVIALVLTAIFLDMAIRTRQLIRKENIARAQVLFKAILLTRQWNADYGGVYVEKKPGVESNPYLENPDITAVDGRVYTLKNPALMTREISQYAEKDGLFKFHITSLKPINPQNMPDAFEKEALLNFDKGNLHEVSRTERINNMTFFRYMAPLFVEKSCLNCHRKQNYAVGDVRGGISITFNVDDIERNLRFNTAAIITFGVITTTLLLGLIYYFMSSLIKKLADARIQIEKIAITDELTGLFNRRHILERFLEEFEQAKRLEKTFSCIIGDIDHFKSVNDQYGHLAGDDVLKEVSHRLKSIIRAYDIVGRYGGEEFLIILPGTDIEQAWHFAERIRMAVKEPRVVTAPVTISLGVTCFEEADQTIDDMIKRADDALYRAKNAGRDRVERTPGP
ncbi:MAG TPA: diguanylate cyclase [Nitrospirota bacterium]|nr:diguanylate cyclase [Nitrospirota bacterium]